MLDHLSRQSQPLSSSSGGTEAPSVPPANPGRAAFFYLRERKDGEGEKPWRIVTGIFYGLRAAAVLDKHGNTLFVCRDDPSAHEMVRVYNLHGWRS